MYVAIITVCKKFIEKHPGRIWNMLTCYLAVQISNNVASKLKKVCHIITKSSYIAIYEVLYSTVVIIY